jgi:hypothetical protein
MSSWPITRILSRDSMYVTVDVMSSGCYDLQGKVTHEENYIRRTTNTEEQEAHKKRKHTIKWTSGEHMNSEPEKEEWERFNKNREIQILYTDKKLIYRQKLRI